MDSLANGSWRGMELKAPVVLAIAVLAIAAWKVCKYNKNVRFFLFMIFVLCVFCSSFICSLS